MDSLNNTGDNAYFEVYMFRTLFVLFLVVPIVEISILIQLSEVIGGWTTILLVVLTAYLGAKMVNSKAWRLWHKFKRNLPKGKYPVKSYLVASVF